MIHLLCPHCKKRCKVSADAAGKRAKCPGCGVTFQIPFPGHTLTAPSSRQPSHQPGKNLGKPRGEAEKQVRAQFLDFLIGQDEIKAEVVSKIAFSVSNKRPLPHLLFCGPPDSGKQTLAFLISRALGVSFQETSAKDMRRSMDVMPFLTAAKEGSILVLKDIDSLGKGAIGFLLPVLSDKRVDIELGEGIDARTISMPLKRFTLVGTTAKPSRVDKRLLPWLSTLDFKPYTPAGLFPKRGHPKGVGIE